MSPNPALLTVPHKGSGSFTPASISGLAAWFDASDAGTFTYSSGVVVSEWRDKSGNARHFTQGTTANQPSRTGTQNGLPIVTFDGTTDSMDTSSFTLAQPLTIVFAANLSSAPASGISSVGVNLQTYWTSADDTFRLYAGSAEVVTLTGAFSGVHVMSALFNGASSRGFRDGTAGSTGNPGSSGTTTGLRIGERNLANRFKNTMFEIAVYNTALGTTDRQAVEAYMKTKWGTP